MNETHGNGDVSATLFVRHTGVMNEFLVTDQQLDDLVVLRRQTYL